jgi:hypothetical protein
MAFCRELALEEAMNLSLDGLRLNEALNLSFTLIESLDILLGLLIASLDGPTLEM